MTRTVPSVARLSRRVLLAAAAVPMLPAIARAQPIRPVTVGQPFLANGTDPGRGSNGWALTSHGVGETLFRLGEDGRVVPHLAAGVQRLEALRWRVTLRDGVRFSDGEQMDAAEMVRHFTRQIEVFAPSRATLGRAGFVAVDRLTFDITTERAVARMAPTLAEWPLIVARQAAADRFAYTGPWQVTALTGDAQMQLVPNPHHPAAPNLPPVTIRRFSDPQAMALAFEGGELDLAFQVPVETLPRLGRRAGARTESITGGYQYYLEIHCGRPPFDDVRVRRAISLALDPGALVRAARGGAVPVGLFSPEFPFTLNQPHRNDAAEANRLLDAAGWTRGRDGIRQMDARRLVFGVAVPVNWPDLVVHAPVTRQMLQAVGIAMEPRQIEAFLPAAESGAHDAIIRTTHSAPGGDPAFRLNDGFRTGGARNYARYSSPELDALLTRLDAAEDGEAVIELAREAQRLLLRDVPTVVLAVAPFHMAFGQRLAGYRVWGADYFILRDDLRLA